MLGRDHRIPESQPRIIILADEHMPPVCGSNADCLLIWRVEAGSFGQMKALMNAQNDMGFKIPPGSLVVCALLTHLFRLGREGFVTELEDFIGWCKRHFDVLVAPTIPPFPQDYLVKNLAAVRQYYAYLQYRHFGRSDGPNQPLFSLWRPFHDLAADESLKELNSLQQFCAQPVRHKHSKNSPDTFYISCDGTFLLGSGKIANWNFGMPAEVERCFMSSLVNEIRKIQTDDNLVAPDTNSISAGLNRGAGNTKHAGRRIFIMGSSNMERLKPALLELATPAGVEICALCEGGDFLSFFFKNPRLLNILDVSTEKDILFFGTLGNMTLTKEFKEKDNNGWHLSKPTMLTDQKFNELMTDFNHALADIRANFHGTIVVFGPYPRMMQDCCLQPQHWIRDDEGKKVDMKRYTEIITDHIYQASALPVNVFFCTFERIFGSVSFCEEMLADRVHLTTPAQRLVANFCFKWLENKDTAPPKPAKGESLLPLSTVLTAEKNHLQAESFCFWRISSL